MPTGYTYNIPEGISQRQFMLQAVRGMAVLITMRDEPADAPIPKEFEPDTFHAESLQIARVERARLQGLSDEEKWQEAKTYNAKARERWHKAEEKTNKVELAYKNMLAKIQAWTLPTLEHERYKNFMIEQITDSIEHDCHHRVAPAVLSPEEWHAQAMESVDWDIEFSERHWLEEVERTKECNAWLTAFWASLPKEE